jgi:hypothetical protein
MSLGGCTSFFLLPGEHQQLFAFGVNKNKSFLGPFASLLF